MPKFTLEKHEERMRKILTQAEPVERAGILSSLLERVRGVTEPTEIPLPRTPRLPETRRPRRI